MTQKESESGKVKSLRRHNSQSQKKRSTTVVPATWEDHQRDRSAALPFEHENFYSIGGYRAVSHGVDKSAALCEQLAKCIHERAHIEKMYAVSLRNFSERWKAKVAANTEFGTLRLAFASIGEHANELSESKLKSYDVLCLKIEQGILRYSAATYKKKMSGYVRTKAVNEDLKGAQKEYAKVHAKLSKHMKQYYHCCSDIHKRKEHLAEADANSAVEPKEIERLREQITKAQKMRTVLEGKYRASLEKVISVCDSYQEKMRDAYKKPSEWHRDRVENMRALMLKCTDVLLDANDSDLRSLKDMERVCQNVNPESDDAAFSAAFGPDQAWERPQFVDWEVGMRSRAQKNDSSREDGGVLPSAPNPPISPVPAINEPAPATEESEMSQGIPRVPSNASLNSANSYNDDSLGPVPPAPPLQMGDGALVVPAASGRVSDEEADEDNEWASQEWDEPEPEEHTSTEVLRYAKALYDYTGQEKDELTFKEDDIIEVYAEEDADGWCCGNHKAAGTGIFLFPALYTEHVEV